jgi:hypothetical protein
MSEERFQCAEDFSRDHSAAVKYLERLPYDRDKGSTLAQFMKTLTWEFRTEHTIEAQVNANATIVHELSPARLHSFPIWGELLWKDSSGNHQEPELFASMECFAAFCLAKWW